MTYLRKLNHFFTLFLIEFLFNKPKQQRYMAQFLKTAKLTQNSA